MVVVGQKVSFDPFAGFKGVDLGSSRVTGEIVEVNYKNKWFSVEWGCPAQRTSFKFCDIGKEVKVYG